MITDPLSLLLAVVLASDGWLPPLSDALYLPSHEECRFHRVNAAVNYNRLRAEWNDGPDRWWYDLATEDAYRRWIIWDTAEDAAAPHFFEHHRREKLARLRDLLGKDAYRHMRLPEPIPSWHLRDETGLPNRPRVETIDEEIPD